MMYWVRFRKLLLVIRLKKLAKNLAKIDIELPKWTRKILYEHILEISKQLNSQLNPKTPSVHPF